MEGLDHIQSDIESTVQEYGLEVVNFSYDLFYEQRHIKIFVKHIDIEKVYCFRFFLGLINGEIYDCLHDKWYYSRELYDVDIVGTLDYMLKHEVQRRMDR